MVYLSKKKIGGILVVLWVFTLFFFGVNAQGQSIDVVRNKLQNQGFTSPLKTDDRSQIYTFLKLGDVYVSDERYEVYAYSLRRKNLGGSAVRETKRLVIISGIGGYMGSYLVDDFPVRVSKNAIYFKNSPETGNEIVFTEDGPPEKAWIDGEVRYLSN